MPPALLVLIAAVTPAAPVPKGARKTDWFPLAVGHKWEYTGPEAQTVEVTSAGATADKKSRQFTVRKRATGTRGMNSVTEFQVGDEGVLLVSTGSAWLSGDIYKKPATFLQLPLQAGGKWQRVLAVWGGRTSTYECEVGEPEQLTVNGREYTATPVAVVPADPAKSRKVVQWYADGVGLVKEEANGTVQLELKSFSPGPANARDRTPDAPEDRPRGERDKSNPFRPKQE